MRIRQLGRELRQMPAEVLRSYHIRRLVAEVKADRSLLARTEWLERARATWGNEVSSAGPVFLSALVELVGSTEGDVLECGSGLSTLITGLAADRTRTRHVALEDSTYWARQCARRLRWAGLRSTPVLAAPLRNLGDFDWYGVPDSVSMSAGLVLCDGPRAAVATGGRVGLPYAAAELLRSTCLVLLDDCERPSEQAAVERWRQDFDVETVWIRPDVNGKRCSLLEIRR